MKPLSGDLEWLNTDSPTLEVKVQGYPQPGDLSDIYCDQKKITPTEQQGSVWRC